MSKTKLVHLDEFRTNWSELSELPDDHLAMVAVLSYAVSETGALARIYLSQAHDHLDKKAIDSAANIQKFLIIRNWSSKLFEVIEFLELGGKKPKTKDLKVLGLANEALARLDLLEPKSGYNVARDIRHEAANHYSFSAAKKNLRHVHKQADCQMYLNRLGGNCFYPFGEEVMFHARLNRKWANLPSKAERDARFGEWLDWNISANRWLAETHAIVTDELIFKALGRNSVRKKVYWVPSELVGRPKENMTPVFYEGTET